MTPPDPWPDPPPKPTPFPLSYEEEAAQRRGDWDTAAAIRANDLVRREYDRAVIWDHLKFILPIAAWLGVAAYAWLHLPCR